MEHRILPGIILLSILFLMTGASQAALVVIGTATYAESEYNLIWDDDNNGNSVVWLDYTYTQSENILSWVESLDSALTYNIDPAYTVDWGTNSWRLPETVDGEYNFHWDGTTTGGYNITNSEMGHLFYGELGNIGYFGIDGTLFPTDWGLNNTGDFENLTASLYWSTQYLNYLGAIWGFDMNLGCQSWFTKSNYGCGLAVRMGQISVIQTGEPVPVPGAFRLFGIGLITLSALQRKNLIIINFLDLFSEKFISRESQLLKWLALPPCHRDRLKKPSLKLRNTDDELSKKPIRIAGKKI